MSSRVWYEVRVRECIEPGRFGNGRWIDGKYTKKSKFFFARDPQDAASKYKGKGYIMYVEKVGMEKLLGIGEFFSLGDSLLRDLRKQGGGLLEQVEGNKEKRKLRRGYYGKEREKASRQYQ